MSNSLEVINAGILTTNTIAENRLPARCTLLCSYEKRICR